MGKKIHFISEKNIELKTGVCSHCGVVKLYKKNLGKGRFQYRCRNVETANRKAQMARYIEKIRQSSEPWRLGDFHIFKYLKGDLCQRCGFVPEDKIQLQIHHLTYNRKKNKPEDIQTLCANCHMLVTKRDRRGIFNK